MGRSRDIFAALAHHWVSYCTTSHAGEVIEEGSLISGITKASGMGERVVSVIKVRRKKLSQGQWEGVGTLSADEFHGRRGHAC